MRLPKEIKRPPNNRADKNVGKQKHNIISISGTEYIMEVK
jgi:hypothetical protein